MAGRVEIQTGLNHVFRRDLVPAAGLVSAGAEDDFDDALTPDTVDVEEGDWVTFDSAGNLIKTTATAPLMAWVVWSDGGRYDVRSTGKVTVLYGPYFAATTKFKTTDPGAVDSNTAPGTGLSAVSGILQEAQTGEPIVAVLEKGPHKTSTTFPDGYITYNTMHSGGHQP